MTKRLDYGYVRVSTDKQTLDQQREAILGSLPADALEPIILEDTGSGLNNKRPDYQRLRRLIEEDRVSTLYVVALDRIGRDDREIQRFVWLCEDHAVRLVSLKERFDMSLDEAKPMITWAAIGAKRERERTSERTSAKFAHYRVTYKHKMHGPVKGVNVLAGKVLCKVASIWALHDAGLSIRAIARNQGLNFKTVKRVLGQPRNTRWVSRATYSAAHPDHYRSPQDCGAPHNERSRARARLLEALGLTPPPA